MLRMLIAVATFCICFGASAQSQPPIIVSAPSGGPTVLTYYLPLVPGCSRVRGTAITRTLNQFVLVSEVVPQNCFPTPPAGTPPVTAVVDLGYLPAGQYQVSWSTVFPFASGNSLPVANASFSIAQNQIPSPIPLLSPSMTAALGLVCFGVAALSLRESRTVHAAP
jgi:hypothetical protein